MVAMIVIVVMIMILQQILKIKPRDTKTNKRQILQIYFGK